MDDNNARIQAIEYRVSLNMCVCFVHICLTIVSLPVLYLVFYKNAIAEFLLHHFYRAAILAYRREPDGPRRVELLEDIRDLEEEILDEMREETIRVQRENDNMEAALAMIRARGVARLK